MTGFNFAAARRIALARQRLLIEPCENMKSYGLRWYECTAPTARLLLSRNPEPIRAGWVALTLTVARPSRPLQVTAYATPSASVGNQKVVLETDGRHLQGLVFVPDRTCELWVEITGGPAQLQIKKASIRELGWLPLSDSKRARRFLEIAFSTWPLRPSRAPNKPKARRTGQQIGSLQNYNRWIELFDTLGPDDCEAIKRHIKALVHRPLFSIVMPVCDIEVKFLREAIDSVRGQLYGEWQLCIADDASDKVDVIECLRDYQELDRRIEVIFRRENGGISAASNTALTLARGEFVAFLDHDDVIRPHALYMVAVELNRYPDADLIYTDEDTIDVNGHRSRPHFKPNWNPSLILSQNFFCHLGVYRRSLVEEVGGFRVGFDGSQDHELLLRCVEHTSPERIRHIPYVLYHWRAIPGSAAHSADSKPHAWEAGRRAIVEHLRRRGIEAEVWRAVMTFYQVDYALPAPPPRVSIIIPTTARLSLIKPCLLSLLQRTNYADFEVLLAINEAHLAVHQRREFLEAIQREPCIRVLVYPDRSFNFSWTNNWACSQAHGSVLCFMNDDVEVICPNWLDALVARVSLDGVGAAGPLLYYPDDTIQHAGVILGSGGVADHAHRYLPRDAPGYFGRAALEQDLSCITAGCMVIRREVFDKLGGFDERFGIAYNDVDLCIRLRRAGWRIIWTATAEMYHRESVSVGRDDSPARRERFQSEIGLMRNRWASELDEDPFYNPNLSLNKGQLFRLAFPPRRQAPWRRAEEPSVAATKSAQQSQASHRIKSV